MTFRQSSLTVNVTQSIPYMKTKAVCVNSILAVDGQYEVLH
jgi:hypothetical protein